MKTTVILSCLLVGSSLTLHTHNFMTSSTVKSEKSSRTKRASFKTMPVAPIRIVIDKSNYELYVYDKLGWFATYPVVFGNNSLDDKKMEGDRNTPEGSFKIVSKRVHEKWDRYMGLDYPNKETLEKFNQWKRS